MLFTFLLWKCNVFFHLCLQEVLDVTSFPLVCTGEVEQSTRFNIVMSLNLINPFGHSQIMLRKRIYWSSCLTSLAFWSNTRVGLDFVYMYWIQRKFVWRHNRAAHNARIKVLIFLSIVRCTKGLSTGFLFDDFKQLNVAWYLRKWVCPHPLHQTLRNQSQLWILLFRKQYMFSVLALHLFVLDLGVGSDSILFRQDFASECIPEIVWRQAPKGGTLRLLTSTGLVCRKWFKQTVMWVGFEGLRANDSSLSMYHWEVSQPQGTCDHINTWTFSRIDWAEKHHQYLSWWQSIRFALISWIWPLLIWKTATVGENSKSAWTQGPAFVFPRFVLKRIAWNLQNVPETKDPQGQTFNWWTPNQKSWILSSPELVNATDLSVMVSLHGMFVKARREKLSCEIFFMWRWHFSGHSKSTETKSDKGMGTESAYFVLVWETRECPFGLQ